MSSSSAALASHGRVRAPVGARAIAAGVAAGVVGVALAAAELGPDGLVRAFLVAVLATVTVSDLERRVIPNRVVLPATAIVLAANLVLHPDRTIEWLASAAGAALFLLLPELIRPGAVGMGDVKLALLLGAALGAAVVGAVVVAALAAFPFALVLAVLGRGSPSPRMLPFGPFLALGAAAVLLTQTAL
jgi:leader peptidase (prepilin peptidase)/N-methyltransferase